MKQIKEGNVYNVQQVVTKADVSDVSGKGIKQWTDAVRKEIMEKLRGYSPEQVDKIMKTTFGDTIKPLS